MEWAELLLAMAAFLAAHVIPMRLRGPLVAALGRRGYMVGYGLVSLALLAWLVVAAGRAPVVLLWDQAPWARWLVNLVMPVAILAGLCGGMAGVMSGFALWAGAHLVANGDLAHVILFGMLAAYAGAGLGAGLRRTRLRGGRLRIRAGWRRAGLAVLVWAGFLHLHPLLIGVSPLP